MKSLELIVVNGKPCAGKTTICRRAIELAEPAGIRHLPMGNRMRAIKDGLIDSRYSGAAAQNEGALAMHEPVPKDLPIKIFEEFVEQDGGGPILLDGFPRYPDRLDGFRASVAKLGAKVVAVCHIDVDDETAYRRSMERPERTKGVSEDRCFIDKRLEDYNNSTIPTINALAQEYPTFVLNGADLPEVNVGIIRGILLASSSLER